MAPGPPDGEAVRATPGLSACLELARVYDEANLFEWREHHNFNIGCRDTKSSEGRNRLSQPLANAL